MSELLIVMVVVLFGLSDANFGVLIQSAVALLTTSITAVVGYLGLKLSQERRDIARRDSEHDEEEEREPKRST